MEQCECLDSIFSSYKGSREELIPLLQEVQQKFGYLPDNAMLAIARFARVPESAVYAVATFYAQFRFTPIGKTHVMVCRGTACHVRGAPRILEAIEKQLGIKEGEATPDLEYSLETVACIGACGLSPCITVNKQVESKATPKKVTELLRRTASKTSE
jgi:NADH-quinone oxidoreductase subunit E